MRHGSSVGGGHVHTPVVLPFSMMPRSVMPMALVMTFVPMRALRRPAHEMVANLDPKAPLDTDSPCTQRRSLAEKEENV